VASTSTKRSTPAPAPAATTGEYQDLVGLVVIILFVFLNFLDAKRQRKSKWDLHNNNSSSKGNSPEPKVGAQALANAAHLTAELNKLGKR